ncbi:MAG: restriction endonuclease subunit S, partial [Planctomycetota bacterium]
PRDWEVTPLGKISQVAGGVTLGRQVTGPAALDVPYLRVANVQDGYLDLSDVKTVRILASEESRYILRYGDVLMNEGGDFDKLGRGTVWEEQIERCTHQNHVFRVRCDEGKLRPWFLAAVSQSRIGKAYFIRASKQTTNLATINSNQIKAFRIPLPALTEQERILLATSVSHDELVAENSMLAKLRLLKQGLMDDLLTGRVRVTGLLEGDDG